MHDRHYIGGGVIAAVCGISPFMTPLRAYHAIQGDLPDGDEQTEQFFKRRKSLEPYAACMLEERGFKVWRQNHRHVDPDYPFLRAELDAELDQPDTPRSAEFKSVHPFAAKAGGKVWGEDGSSEFPDYVNVQMQHGFGVSRIQEGFAVAIIGLDDSRVYPVRRDEGVLKIIRATAVKFWEDHVLKNSPPPITNLEDVLDFIDPVLGKMVDARDVGIEKEVAELRAARLQYKSAKDNREAMEATIKMRMGEATVLTLDGKQIATWNPQKAKRIDVTALRAKDPATARAFEREDESRVFRFKD